MLLSMHTFSKLKFTIRMRLVTALFFYLTFFSGCEKKANQTSSTGGNPQASAPVRIDQKVVTERKNEQVATIPINLTDVDKIKMITKGEAATYDVIKENDIVFLTCRNIDSDKFLVLIKKLDESAIPIGFKFTNIHKLNEQLMTSVSKMDNLRGLRIAGDDGKNLPQALDLFSKSKGLKFLSIFFPKSSNSEFEKLRDYTKLEILELYQLDMKNKKHSHELFSHLVKMNQLKKLVLYGEIEISDQSLEYISQLESLEYFEVMAGEKTTTDQGIAKIEKLVNLKQLTLDLAGNNQKISAASLDSIAKLPRLEELKTINWHFNASEYQRLSPLSKTLRKLECHTKMKDLLPNIVSLKELESIYTPNRGPLTDEVMTGLLQFPKLKEFGAGDFFDGPNVIKLTDAGLSRIRELKELNSIHLGRFNITDAGVKHLSGMPNLHSVFLMDTQVTDKCIDDLITLPKLKLVWFGRNTKVTDAGKQKLMTAKPGIQIN